VPGVLLELIAVATFLALVVFLFWDAGFRVSRKVLVLGGIIILAVFGFITISEW